MKKPKTKKPEVPERMIRLRGDAVIILEDFMKDSQRNPGNAAAFLIQQGFASVQSSRSAA